MVLSQNQTNNIENVLRTALRNKFRKYKPESTEMPFHKRLIGGDRMALFSFIHSLNTNFGTTIFEPVAKALATSSFLEASSQQIAGTHISSEAKKVIDEIIYNLENASSELPNKLDEIEEIRRVCQSGELQPSKFTKVDLKLVSSDGIIYLFDIKTPKPNKGGYAEFKRTLLKWVATVLADNPNADIYTGIALPYNPYHPKPYKRWTMRGMIDLNNELKVAEDFESVNDFV